MASIISVGDKVDLRIIKHKQTSNAIDKEYRIYKSKIYDIADEKILKLSMPIEGGSIVLLPLGQVFEIYFYTMNGLYQAKGKVIKRLKENNIFVFLFELSTPIKKNQRREFFRFDCVIDMKYSQVSEYESRLVLQNEIEDARGNIIEWQNGQVINF
jgi:c-di-GMP-binding flagellar brake protein YcgR